MSSEGLSTPPASNNDLQAICPEQDPSTDSFSPKLLTLASLIEHLGNGLGAHADIDETFRAVRLYLDAQQGKSPLDQLEEAHTRKQILRQDLGRLSAELEP